MSFSYLIDAPQELYPAMRQFTAKLVRLHPGLRGMSLEPEGQRTRIKLRLAGLTRWHVQGLAPRILNIYLRKFKIPVASAVFDSMVTEPGRGHMVYGQGRTEMTRRPRSERMSDGRPWDHIAWEGDEIDL